MKKTILTFGTMSGVICSVLMVATIPFADAIGFSRSMVVGYATMVASFLLVYFGIRSHRDNVCNGQIAFTKAFVLGLSITLMTCVFYVATWEILYFNFMPDFMTKYGAHLVENARAAGESPAAIEAKVQQLKKSKALYDNLFVNAAMTFLEPFPVGLLVTLLSAAVLQRKGQPQSVQSALSASR